MGRRTISRSTTVARPYKEHCGLAPKSKSVSDFKRAPPPRTCFVSAFGNLRLHPPSASPCAFASARVHTLSQDCGNSCTSACTSIATFFADRAVTMPAPLPTSLATSVAAALVPTQDRPLCPLVQFHASDSSFKVRPTQCHEPDDAPMVVRGREKV